MPLTLGVANTNLLTFANFAGIEFISTPFDNESATFLNEMMDFFKISSSDITNKPFIKKICRYGKPIILSTGASNLWEIEEAVSWIEKFQIPTVLMHCILNYPTENKNANLGMILDLKRKFPDKNIGYSDHTLPEKMKSLEIATLLGACVLEKHFTYDKKLQGNDHYHSMDKNDLKEFLANLENIFELLGGFSKNSLSSEEPARQHARRSLVINQFIPKGKQITEKDLTFKRPAHGISPRCIDDVIGRFASHDLDEDILLQWNDLQTQ